MRLVLIGLTAGFFSALFGVGGGIVIVPLLLLVAAFPPHEATATSLGAIAVTALAGVVAYALRHDIRYAYAALVGVPATVGALGGALGIAVLATVANTTTRSDTRAGVTFPHALTHGFQNAFWVGVGVAAVGVAVAVLFVRRSDLVPAAASEPVVEAA